MELLINNDVNIRVSSVFNRDTKQYGKKYLIDGSDDTCWSSDQGSNHWIDVDFSRDVCLSQINIQFHGGFSSANVLIQLFDSNQQNVFHYNIYPDDSHSLQKFSDLPNIKIKSIKMIFSENTDLFGRIIIYKLEILGN